MALRFEASIPRHLPTLASSLPNPSSPFLSHLRPSLSRFSLSRRPAGVKIAIEEGPARNRIRCIAEREAGNEVYLKHFVYATRIRNRSKLSVSFVQSPVTVKKRSVSVVLLAGGKGKRMGASMPKQYLPLLGQPIALYSFYTFSQMIEVKEIVVVCDPSYKDIFEEAGKEKQVNIKFALPGKERQDSVFNGFQEIDGSSELVCIHDSARPLVSSGDIEKVLKDGWLNGAAVLGVPVKATIKEANSDSFVVKTLNRKTLWEMQTPQVIKPELLRLGFDIVNRHEIFNQERKPFAWEASSVTANFLSGYMRTPFKGARRRTLT